MIFSKSSVFNLLILLNLSSVFKWSFTCLSQYVSILWHNVHYFCTVAVLRSSWRTEFVPSLAHDILFLKRFIDSIFELQEDSHPRRPPPLTSDSF